MSPEEAEGVAAAVLRAIDARCARMLADQAQALEEVRRSAEQSIAALTERCERADTRANGLQRDLDASRELIAQPAVTHASMDADGVLHIVQRNGSTLTARLPAVERLVREAVDAAREAIRAELRDELLGQMHADIARSFELHNNAPTWSAAAVYTEGQIVQAYMGRVFRMRAGIKASLSQEPGDHPAVWERLGTQGLRVLKSRPAQLQAGDLFTEHDSKFLHDGITTNLLAAKGVKASDVERSIKPTHAMVQAANDALRQLGDRFGSFDTKVAQIARSIDEATEPGIQALAQVETIRREVERLRDLLRDSGAEAA